MVARQWEVALGSSLQSKWHRLGQAVVIENKDSNASAVFEAKWAGSALGYWGFVFLILTHCRIKEMGLMGSLGRGISDLKVLNDVV